MSSVMVVEQLALGIIQSLIGLVFGMSLVYMARHSSKDKMALALGVIVLFYVMLFVLRDFVLARRMVQLFALAHVAMVGFIIMRKKPPPRRPDNEQK